MIAKTLLANHRLVSPLLQFRFNLFARVSRVRIRLLIVKRRFFRHDIRVWLAVMRRRTGHAITANELELIIAHGVIFITVKRIIPFFRPFGIEVFLSNATAIKTSVKFFTPKENEIHLY